MGVYGANGEEAILDGLFCDDTKAGIFAWRRAMGMEHEESLKLEVRGDLKSRLTSAERDVWRLHRSEDPFGIVQLRDQHSVSPCHSERRESALRDVVPH